MIFKFFCFYFCFPLQFFSLTGVFSHIFFLFSFFVGVAEGSEFLAVLKFPGLRIFTTCEILQVMKFRNL